MVRLKLNLETLGHQRLIERSTGAHVKDCFLEGEILYVVVGPGHLGKVIGTGGKEIRRLQERLQLRLRVVEYNDNLTRYIKNFIYPVEMESVSEENSHVVVHVSSKKAKGLLIGRDGKQLQLLTRAVQRFFPIETIKIQ